MAGGRVVYELVSQFLSIKRQLWEEEVCSVVALDHLSSTDGPLISQPINWDDY